MSRFFSKLLTHFNFFFARKDTCIYMLDTSGDLQLSPHAGDDIAGWPWSCDPEWPPSPCLVPPTYQAPRGSSQPYIGSIHHAASPCHPDTHPSYTFPTPGGSLILPSPLVYHARQGVSWGVRPLSWGVSSLVSVLLSCHRRWIRS